MRKFENGEKRGFFQISDDGRVGNSTPTFRDFLDFLSAELFSKALNKTNRDIEIEMQTHLDQDEKILWTGIPKQGFSFQRIDAIIIPFSLLWGGLAFLGLYNSVATGAPMLYTNRFLIFDCRAIYDYRQVYR